MYILRIALIILVTIKLYSPTFIEKLFLFQSLYYT